MATKGQQGLTHDEIWDDSALVDSWNEALEEYKVGLVVLLGPVILHLPGCRCRRFGHFWLTAPQKYHSIHVKGGNVEDLINEKYALPGVWVHRSRNT